jgi:hypothetical protein
MPPAALRNASANAESVLREAFLRRTTEALKRIAREAPREALADALAAATDVGALARVLGDSAAVGPAVSELEPLGPALARNARHRDELMELAGGALSAGDVGSLLGISRQAVDKRRRAHALLAVRMGGDWGYPRRQFDEANHDVAPGVAKATQALAESGPWATLDFLLTPDAALEGRSPLDVLREGDPDGDVDRLLRQISGDGFA